MEENIESAYEAKKYEDKIYAKWEASGVFSPIIDKNKKPFVISMPPPNATGTLHLGHAVMLAIEDIMIRHHRMLGDPTLWIPGTDHAAIATQNKVEQILLEEKNLTRHDLGREKFLHEVREYVKDSQSTIRNQIRKMGSSCDWTRERYTLDQGLNDAVEEVFIRMYNDGLIYRGNRIVNWCPRCASTLADDEVDYKEINATLYYFKYGPFVVATSRPETKLGDTGVAVHPDDKRYKKYIGETMDVFFGDHKITVKVIGDKDVDPKFGSGALGVTPAHSFIDYEMAQKHNLEIKQVINEEGKMTKVAGKYAGQKVKEARENFANELRDLGLMEKEEPYTQNLSVCYRCKHPVEPLMSKQWFVDVDKAVINHGGKKKSIKERSIEVVKDGDIKIVPSRFNKIYFNWMENLHDWCISRQIWWGHRIPVWYCKECDNIVAGKTKPGACNACKKTEWKQDPDTLDTWFSSGLWTFSTLGWPEETDEFKYFHPTSVLETGYDIIFFWVARMIIMSTYAVGEIPFETVYLHGLIRDKDGKKMSKSLGNGIDPLEMIEKYGTDAVRLSLVIGNTPGNDMRLYEEKISGYRNFVNKIWNATRFALMNVDKEDLKKEFEQGMIKTFADKWVLTKLQNLILEVDKDMKNYRLSDAGTKIYNFFWSMFCDWYLEVSKGEYKNPAVLAHVLKTSLKLLHPFTPFVTEKLWEFIDKDTQLISESWPKADKKLIFTEEEKAMELIHDIITKIRSTRSELNVQPAKLIHAIIYGGKFAKVIESKREALMRMARLESLNILEKGPKIANSKVLLIEEIEVHLPLKDLIDPEKELKRIEKEIENKEQFIKSLDSKLSNKGFVDNAPKDLLEEQRERLNGEKENLKKLKKQKRELEEIG